MKNHNNNYSNQQFRQTCDLANTTRVDCNSTSLPGGNAFIPVVLGDVELQALVESEYTLPTPAREIKNVRRNVSLNQCRAIASSIPSRGFFSQVKVFVSGVIHKNIQYVEDCNGYVRDYSVEVPFSCNQSLFVRRAPQGNFSSKSNAANERVFSDSHGHGGDHYQSGGSSYEFYNEPIECKLLFSLVNDLDLYQNIDADGNFDQVTEKAEVILIFKLIQNQQANIRLHGQWFPFLEPDNQLPDANEMSQQQSQLLQQNQQILIQQLGQQGALQIEQPPASEQPQETESDQSQTPQARIRAILQSLYNL